MTDLLTPDELALRWRVSRDLVIRLAQRGKLRSVRVGRHYRFRVEDVEEYLRAHGSLVGDVPPSGWGLVGRRLTA